MQSPSLRSVLTTGANGAERACLPHFLRVPSSDHGVATKGAEFDDGCKNSF